MNKYSKTSKNISTKQKGDIAESIIVEFITLYGETTLSCYKPISDDDGIDLIVKEKGGSKTVFLQIKSRFGDEISNRQKHFSVKTKTIPEDRSLMAFIFCIFDIDKGEFSDLWFVPAKDFINSPNKSKDGKILRFARGNNKWDEFLIDKKELANKIREFMLINTV